MKKRIVRIAATIFVVCTIVLVLPGFRPVFSAGIFADDFESGTFAAWNGVKVSAGETASISDAMVHHGTHSAKFTSNGNLGTERTYCYKTLSLVPELYARGYFYVSTSGITGNDNRFYFLIFKAGSNPVAFAGWRMTGGVVKWNLLIRQGTGWATAYSTTSPSLNQWYSVELYWKKDATAGLGELWVNGALACSASGKNTAYYGDINRVDFGLAEIFNCHSTTVYSDCVKIADTYISPEPSHTLQYVSEDRILDENGDEVMWRGVGVSYLLGASDYVAAWQARLPEMKAMGVNVVRLAFHFSIDVGPVSSLLDYTKLDWVLNFLAQNNIKAILDNHPAGSNSAVKSFGTDSTIKAWKELAARYEGDPRIAAYELYNEPGNWAWSSSIASTLDVVKYYANLTKEVRKVDSDHIVIWQTGNAYLPEFEKWFNEYAQPNVVYSFHTWWQEQTKSWQFNVWTIEQISIKMMDPIVYARAKWNVPFWLGEFGTLAWQYDATNPTWTLTEQNLWRCEEQLVGWSLWEGGGGLSQYLPLFPLKTYNSQMLRKPWAPTIPRLTDSTISPSGGIDNQGYISAELLHNYDRITLKAGIKIQVVTTIRLADGSIRIFDNKNTTVTSPLSIQNQDGPKYDIFIYVLE